MKTSWTAASGVHDRKGQDMGFIIEHTRIGFELPELIALIFLIAVVVFFIVRSRQMKKAEEELEDQIRDIQSGKSSEGRVQNP